MSTIKGRVALGARLLDDYKTDWYVIIDMDRLATNGPTDILVQVFGSTAAGIVALEFQKKEKPSRCGFALHSPPTQPTHHQAEKVSLLWWWIYQIKMRRRMAAYTEKQLEVLDYEDFRWLLHEAGVLFRELSEEDEDQFSDRERALIRVIQHIPSRPPGSP